MRISFYNSSGSAAFWQAQLRHVSEAGHQVESLSVLNTMAGHGAVGGIARRWRMYPGYGMTILRNVRKPADINVVTTNPFFAPYLVSRLAPRGAQTVNLLYDLFPEALTVGRVMSPRSPLVWVLRHFTRVALRDCAATVFLGARLKAYAESVYGPARRSAIIPVGADGAPFRGCPPAPPEPGGRPRVLYSGNLGKLHDVGTLLDFFTEGQGGAAAVDFLFNASGDGYRALCAQLHAKNCLFHGPLGGEDWICAMRNAHVALVTMRTGAETVVMPSKTYSALVAGQAILAICPEGSDLADLVKKHDCGWHVPVGDQAALAWALAAIQGKPEELQRKRLNAYNAGHGHYDMKHVSALWLDLFNDLATSRERTAPGWTAHEDHQG